MSTQETFKNAETKPTALPFPAVFCHVCGRDVKLTKDGRYRRHGYKRSYASRNYYGVPYVSGYSGVETKKPCWASGELPLP